MWNMVGDRCKVQLSQQMDSITVSGKAQLSKLQTVSLWSCCTARRVCNIVNQEITRWRLRHQATHRKETHNRTQRQLWIYWIRNSIYLTACTHQAKEGIWIRRMMIGLRLAWLMLETLLKTWIIKLRQRSEYQTLQLFHVAQVTSLNLRGLKMFRNKFSSRQVEKLCLSIWLKTSPQKNPSSAENGSVNRNLKVNDHQLKRSPKLLTSFTLSTSRQIQSMAITAGDQNLPSLRISSSRGDVWAKVDRKTNNYPSKTLPERSWSRTSILVPKGRWTLRNHSSTKQGKIMGPNNNAHPSSHPK